MVSSAFPRGRPRTSKRGSPRPTRSGGARVGPHLHAAERPQAQQDRPLGRRARMAYNLARSNPPRSRGAP